MAKRHKQGESLLHTVNKIHGIALRRAQKTDQSYRHANYATGLQEGLPRGSIDDTAGPVHTPVTSSTIDSEAQMYATTNLTPASRSYTELDHPEMSRNSKLAYTGQPALPPNNALLFDDFNYGSEAAISSLSEQQLDNFDWFEWEFWNHARNTAY